MCAGESAGAHAGPDSRAGLHPLCAARLAEVRVVTLNGDTRALRCARHLRLTLCLLPAPDWRRLLPSPKRAILAGRPHSGRVRGRGRVRSGQLSHAVHAVPHEGHGRAPAWCGGGMAGTGARARCNPRPQLSIASSCSVFPPSFPSSPSAVHGCRGHAINPGMKERQLAKAAEGTRDIRTMFAPQTHA